MSDEIPKLYRTFGSFGNNTTIPDSEKYMIAGASADLPALEEARARYRLERDQHYFYKELGLAPEGTWQEFLGVAWRSLPNPSLLPLSDQLKMYGKLSKSVRNWEKVLKKKDVKKSSQKE